MQAAVREHRDGLSGRVRRRATDLLDLSGVDLLVVLRSAACLLVVVPQHPVQPELTGRGLEQLHLVGVARELRSHRTVTTGRQTKAALCGDGGERRSGWRTRR